MDAAPPTPAAPTAGAREGLSGEQMRELASLKYQVTGRDFDKAVEALGRIEAMGPGAGQELSALLRSLLVRNAAAVDQAARAVGSPEQAASAAGNLADLRAEARANIAKLSKDDDSIPKAWEYYRKLIAAAPRVTRTLEARSRVVDAVGQRLRLLELFGSAGAKGGMGDDVKSAAADPAPMQAAEVALGTSLQQVPSPADLEKEAALKDVLDYRLNRRIQAWNRQLAGDLHAEEYRNVLTLNDYREALGLPRLEIDLRLTQSARRHSKEMADLGYFSHTSPTKGLEGFGERVRAAGYPSPGGENIATGTRLFGGVKAFEMWFGSPPHHQNMVAGGYTAIGVGKWAGHWTQNFGRDRRLMLADAPTRQAATPQGKLLPPGR